MPFIQLKNAKYYYEEHGSGEDTIVLSHGLLWSGHLFHKQVDFFKSKYRVIIYDHRGQGKTEVTSDGYDMDTLYEDAVELIEKLSDKPVIFGGLSMGGFIGMRLAARRPDLIKKLILMETSCEPEPLENVGKYKTLNTVVKYIGIWAVVPNVIKIMFGQKFLTDVNRSEERKYWIQQLRNNNRTGITRAVMGVVERKSVEGEITSIKCPTLILVGDQDIATKPEKAKKIHSLIHNSKLIIVSGGGHSSSIEEPIAYNQAIKGFLLGI